MVPWDRRTPLSIPNCTRLVQTFLQGSWSWQTGRPRYSVCNRRLRLRGLNKTVTTTTTTILWAFFRDYPGEPVPEENFLTFWCKGRLTEADTDHLAGRHSIRTNQCSPPPSPIVFYRPDALPAVQPTVSKRWRTSAFGLGRRRYISQRCYPHRLRTLIIQWLLRIMKDKENKITAKENCIF